MKSQPKVVPISPNSLRSYPMIYREILQKFNPHKINSSRYILILINSLNKHSNRVVALNLNKIPLLHKNKK